MSEPTRERLGDYELVDLIGDGAQGSDDTHRQVAAHAHD